MSGSIESSEFVSHRESMSGEFNSRKDSHSTVFERELWDWKLSGLHPFDNVALIHWVKNRLKIERQAVSSWDTNPWSDFCHNLS